MRFHHDYPLFQLWMASPSRAIVRPENLALARFEPVVAGGVTGGALLDLVFSDRNSIAVMPYLQVAPQLLMERERTPLIWPHAARDLGYEQIDSLESVLLPWLESLTLARQANEELIRPFSDALDQRIFEGARAAGFFGAARYAQTMAAFAPYVYAVRFARDRNVVIRDAQGANGAAMLSTRAEGVCADLGTGELNALAARWFGLDMFGTTKLESDITISRENGALSISVAGSCEEMRNFSIASPVPNEVMVSFDLDDSPPAGSFDVRAAVDIPVRELPAVTPAAANGGSSGRVLMLMREDFARTPDADVDEAQFLAGRLRAEGFTVDLCSPALLSADSHADLVHVFGLSNDAALVNALRRFSERGVPVVATANLARTPQEAVWGPRVLRGIFGRATDEAWLEEYFELLELRKVQTQETPHASLADVPALVDAAIVSTAGEEAQLRDLGFKGQVIHSAPAIARESDVCAISPLVGTAPFAFVHAPVEWRTNLPLMVRAAAPRGIPVVVAGPAIDIDCLRAAQRFAPELLIHVPKASAVEIEALYRTARVYADVSWSPRGIARAARAAASGCGLLLSNALPAGDLWTRAERCDPASLGSIDSAINRAWNAPQARADAPCGRDAFSAAIFAYSQAQQRRLPA